MTDAADDAIDEAEVEALPESFAGKVRERINDVAVVKLVDAPFLSQNPRHLPKRSFDKRHPADRYNCQSQNYRKDGQQPLLRNFFGRMLDVLLLGSCSVRFGGRC